MKMTVALVTLIVASLCAAETISLSPAERSVAQANRLLEKNAKDFEAYNALALALSRRVRETSDVSFYAQAEIALQKSFALAPDNFDGARIHVWLLLGRHEFSAALEEARKLSKKMPDDVMVYGFLTDANVELGNYKEAEAAAQLMLDLRPGNLPALTRAAYLRELFGDVDGALDLMAMALESTPPSEHEDAAWILTQMAHLEWSRGRTVEAEAFLHQALASFPNYHYALGTLAKVRTLQKRHDEAVTLLKQRYQAAPHAENLYDLAEAEQAAGKATEAKQAFAEFEQKSLFESKRGDNSNRELIFYYADYAHEPSKALGIAEQEFLRRHDVYTLDAYAWALHVNRRDREARLQAEAALGVGIHDAKLLWHAGEIALALADQLAAKGYLQQASDLHTLGSERAMSLLASMAGTGNQQAGRAENPSR